MNDSKKSKRVLSQAEYQQIAGTSAAAKMKRGRGADPAEQLERRHRAQSFIQGKELDELEMEVETGLYENVDLSHGSRVPIAVAQVLFSKSAIVCVYLQPAILRSVA